MAITFAVRGNSLDARYSTGRKSPALFTETNGLYPPTVVSAVVAGMIGDSYIDLYQGGAVSRCGLIYDGFNSWSGQPFSILFRAARKRNADMGMFGTAAPSGETQSTNCVFRSTNGNVYIQQLRNDAGQEMLGQESFGVDMTLDTVHDIVITSTGQTGANGVKVYRDGTLVGQFANVVAGAAQRNRELSKITLGFALNLVVGGFWVNEFVIWDDVINVGANGLTGADRTTFVPCDEFDGTLSVSPGVGNVRQFTDYTINGSTYQGTLVVPTSTDPGEENVLEGVTYLINDSNKTGTYDVLTSTDPGVANVADGVSYTINDVVKTGTLMLASSSSEVTVYTSPSANNPKGQSVPIIQGEDRTMKLNFVRADGTDYDLSTATEITVKLLGKYSLIEKTLGASEVTRPTSSQIEFTLTDSETDSLKVQDNQSIEITVDVSSTRRIFIVENGFSVTKRLFS